MRNVSSRNTIAEWACTILLLLFGATTLCQAFVIPTGSMEDSLRVGDHVLVDKLAYAPAGSLSSHLLPYQHPKHGDIIVFRYPPDSNQTLVKRLMRADALGPIGAGAKAWPNSLTPVRASVKLAASFCSPGYSCSLWSLFPLSLFVSAEVTRLV
jgi:signal peptidase I